MSWASCSVGGKARFARRSFALLSAFVIVLPAVAFTLPDDDGFLSPDDIDRWEAEGVFLPEESNQLREWLEQPLDLSEASRADLLLLPGLGDEEVNRLLDARRRGLLRSTADLDALSLTPEAIAGLLPFVMLGPAKGARASYGGHVRQQFSDTRNDGTPAALRGYVRFRPSDAVTIAFAETAGGRPLWTWDPDVRRARPVDSARLTRAFVSREGAGPLRRWIVGDFHVGSGTGLLLNTARRRHPSGIGPNDTSMPRQRGIAAEWAYGVASGFAFYSRTSENAMLPPDVSGLDRSRSISEAVQERFAGARVEMGDERARIGGTLIGDVRVNRTPAVIEGWRPGGTIGGSVDVASSFRGVRWIAEVARAGKTGLRAEASTSNARGTALVTAYALPIGFDGAHGRGPGGRSGMFARGRFRPGRGWLIGGELRSERRLPEEITRHVARLWFSTRIRRNISAGASLYVRDDDVLRNAGSFRRSTEWVRASTRIGGARLRLSQSGDRGERRTDAARWDLFWSAWRSGSLGARVLVAGRPDWAGGVRMTEAAIYASVRMPPRWYVRFVVRRRWLTGGPRNDARILLDYRWGTAS